jgi:ADP-heptose:LPS heptosyltransferase
LIRLASAHVGGDTGSTHIAAAMDIPAVGLYSTTRPERSCPYGQIASCHFSPDGLAHIQPDAVIATLRDILDRP